MADIFLAINCTKNIINAGEGEMTIRVSFIAPYDSTFTGSLKIDTGVEVPFTFKAPAGETEYSKEFTFTGLRLDTKYYFSVVVYDSYSNEWTVDEYFETLKLSDSPPSCEIVAISRTSDTLSVTIVNTSAITYQFTLYSGDEYSSDTQNDFNKIYLDIEPDAEGTFTRRLTNANQYRPMFFFIYADDSEGQEHFFPNTKQNPIRVQGKKYAVFTNTESGWYKYIVKVDVESVAPWDIKYGTTTSPSEDTQDFMWAPFTNTSSTIVGDNHHNTYCSTNYHLHSTDSVMIIKFNLKYKSVISFDYYVGCQNVSTEYLEIDFNGNIAQKRYSANWYTYSETCEPGINYVLKLTYHKNASTNANGDTVYFANFKITPTLPTEWDWQASNGSAAAEQTQVAHTAITNKGNVGDFSYLVWNDMVNKTMHILDYLEGDYNCGVWDTTYGCDYEDTLMTNTEKDRELTAKKFNSLRYNIDQCQTTDIGTVTSGDIVYGWYFTKLMECVNTYIRNSMGT